MRETRPVKHEYSVDVDENYIDETQGVTSLNCPLNPMCPFSFRKFNPASQTLSPRTFWVNSSLESRGTSGVFWVMSEEFSYLILLRKYASVFTSCGFTLGTDNLSLTVFCGSNNPVLSVSSFIPPLHHLMNVVPACDELPGAAAAPTLHHLTWRQIDETLRRHLLSYAHLLWGRTRTAVYPCSASYSIICHMLIYSGSNPGKFFPFFFFFFFLFLPRNPDGSADKWTDRKDGKN